MMASFFLVSDVLIASLISRFASSSAEPSAASAAFLRYATPRKKAITAPTKKAPITLTTNGMNPIVLMGNTDLLYSIFNVRNPRAESRARIEYFYWHSAGKRGKNAKTFRAMIP